MKTRIAFLLASALSASLSANDVLIQLKSAELSRFATRSPQLLGQALQTDYIGFSTLRLSAENAERLRKSGASFEELDANAIRFGRISIDPIAMNLPSATDSAGLKLLQFQSQIKAQWLDQLTARGLVLLQAYPGNAMLVWSEAGQTRGLAAAAEIRWVGDFIPEYKVDRTLDPTLPGRIGLIENVIAHVYANDLNATRAQLSAAGAQIITAFAAQPDQRIFDVVLRANDQDLGALAQIASVIMLSYSSPRGFFDDEMSSQIVAGNFAPSGTATSGPGYLSFLTNLGLSGQGVTWAVTDSGVDLTHPEFATNNRIAGGYTYPGCVAGNGAGDDSSTGGHGTHVAGIIASAGTLNLLDANGFNYGIGVAPQARIFAQNPICRGGQPWPPVGGWQETSKRALAGGAIGTNNSWTSGEGTNAGYTNGARSHDLMVRDGDFDTPSINEAFMVVFSAGNSGPNANTLTAPKEAKNPIVVASSRNQRAGLIGDIANSSSRGPSVDGRIVPTLAAPGEAIASTRRVAGGANCVTAIAGTSNNYALCSGTSMAAPHVSGTAALITQWYRNRNQGATPSPALVKALLVNGAVDMSGPAAIPNSIEGWGRVHLPTTVSNDKVLLDQTTLLTDVGAEYTMQTQANDLTKPVRITLTWTDAPAAIAANPTLVNDLDLEVNVGGTIYLGNVFLSGQSNTGGSADRRNNVENVYLPAGTDSFSIRVRAQNLPGDGVPNAGDSTDQDFALVCGNCRAEPSFTLAPRITFGGRQCSNGYTLNTLDIGATSGFSAPVQLSSENLPSGVSLSFASNPVLPGSSVMTTLTLQDNAPAGRFSFDVVGNAAGFTRRFGAELIINTADAQAVALSAPADSASSIPRANVQLSWTPANADPVQYTVQLSTSASMSPILHEAIVSGTSYTVPASVALSANTGYFWRVVSSSSCFRADPVKGFERPRGSTADSVIRSFTTAP
jgi:subtilisin family serine protease